MQFICYGVKMWLGTMICTVYCDKFDDWFKFKGACIGVSGAFRPDLYTFSAVVALNKLTRCFLLSLEAFR